MQNELTSEITQPTKCEGRFSDLTSQLTQDLPTAMELNEIAVVNQTVLEYIFGGI